MVYCDQCMYGLCSATGRPQGKSTRWCTSSTAVAEQLDGKCNKSHEHEPILGRGIGEKENKSTQAKRYPAGLVQAIIRGYKRHVQDELMYVQFSFDFLDFDPVCDCGPFRAQEVKIKNIVCTNYTEKNETNIISGQGK